MRAVYPNSQTQILSVVFRTRAKRRKTTRENPHAVLGLDVGFVLQQEGYFFGITALTGPDEVCGSLLTEKFNPKNVFQNEITETSFPKGLDSKTQNSRPAPGRASAAATRRARARWALPRGGARRTVRSLERKLGRPPAAPGDCSL